MLDDEFHELHNLSEASLDILKSISASPFDGPDSPSSSDGDENRQSDLEPHASKSEANLDDEGMQHVPDPRMPQAFSPATPMQRETKHLKECGSLFRLLLSRCGDSEATILSAGDLCELLKRFGMPPEVTKDELRDMLTMSQYADESGFLDFEYFKIFAEDFELLESLLAYNVSQQKGGEYSERGPLRDLFDALAANHRDARQRKECGICFNQLLSHRGDPTAIVLPAGDLCAMLKTLGMAPMITEDEIQGILTTSEYADGNGTLDFERFMLFAGDFKLFESLRACKASQQKGDEYVQRGPLGDFFKILKFGGSEPGFPGPSSNDGGKGKHPLFEPPELPISTSASPNYRDSIHRKECKSRFKQLLSIRGDPNATALPAGSLCGILKKLGMAQEVTKYELRDMLKFSGYADEDGNFDLERFTIFAKDFLLLETVRVRKASRLTDQGSLGDFFEILQSDEVRRYSNADISEAFDRLGIVLTEYTADFLARYANLHPGVNITFEQFGRVFRKAQEKHMQGGGQTMLSQINVALDKGHRLGRLMAFVSKYTRSDRTLRKAIKHICIKWY